MRLVPKQSKLFRDVYFKLDSNSQEPEALMWPIREEAELQMETLVTVNDTTLPRRGETRGRARACGSDERVTGGVLCSGERLFTQRPAGLQWLRQ